MSNTIHRSFSQSIAIASSECLRMATSPAWAILLFLWTLVCGLFFQIVINYAAANALPVGETPMSYFFRTAPFLFPLLLIVFVPQLTMDVVAGRRERGRMEHLLISGVHPGALITGAFIAICGLLILLLIPPLLFHGIVGLHAEPDIGKTCSALCSLFVIGSCVAALGLAVSCWAPNRLAASLIAVSIGIAWWIIDVFGQQIDQSDTWESWRASMAMSLTIYDSASGLIEPRLISGFLILCVCLLYIARCGLDWHRYPRSRIVSSILAFIMACIIITHFQSWRSRWDMTSYRTHSVEQQTQALCQQLVNEGGLQVSLASTPGMRSDHIDGPIYNRCRHIFQRLEADGLVFNEMDPGLDPNASMQLTREHNINTNYWQHPLIIVSHLNQHVVLHAKQLAVYAQVNDRIELQGLRCEGAFLAAMNYLRDGRHQRVAWLQNKHVRPITSDLLYQRNITMQSAQQRLISDGYLVETINSIEQVDKSFDLLVIGGAKNDLSVKECAHLHDLLEQDVSILLMLNPNESHAYQENISNFLNDFNIIHSNGVSYQADGPKAHSIISAFNTNTHEAFKLFQQEQRPFLAVHSMALSIGKRPKQSFNTELFFGSSKELLERDQNTFIKIPQNHFLAISSFQDPSFGVLGVCGSVDSFSDAYFDRAHNSHVLSQITRFLCKQKLNNTLPAESVSAQRFNLSTTQKLLLIWFVGIGFPIASAAVGIFIAYRRRRVT